MGVLFHRHVTAASSTFDIRLAESSNFYVVR